MRAPLRFGRYIRVVTDQGSYEDWYIYPSNDILYIQRCVNMASTYGQARGILNKVGMKQIYQTNSDGYRI